MIIRCVDWETTGLDPKTDRICEIGWCDLTQDGDAWIVGDPKNELINPGRPIPPEASAVHHIIDADVAEARTFTASATKLLKDSPSILCAHKASFEQSFFTTPAPWICTWKVALLLAPNAPGWSLQVLRYWLKLNVDRGLAEPPHRSGPDAYICAALLARMLAKMPAQAMVELSARPAILPKFTFAKWAMKPIEDIDLGYLEWMVKQPDMDADAKYTATLHLAAPGARGMLNA